MLSSGNLKQVIAKIYNDVNQEIFGIGVIRQKVDIIEAKIVIIAVNKRVPALAALDIAEIRTREVDLALLDSFKRRFKEQIESELGLSVQTVLKDYDPKTELAGTIVVLDDCCFRGSCFRVK